MGSSVLLLPICADVQDLCLRLYYKDWRVQLHRIKSPQDLGAGLVFVFIGCTGLYFGMSLTYGSARTMGPGYFPIWLSAIILLMGLICLVKALLLNGPPIDAVKLRPIICVFAGVLAFGYLVEDIRLEPALILLTVIATQGRSDTNQKQMLLLAVTMAFASVLIFVVLLGQAMPTWSGEYISMFFAKTWALISAARGH